MGASEKGVDKGWGRTQQDKGALGGGVLEACGHGASAAQPSDQAVHDALGTPPDASCRPAMDFVDAQKLWVSLKGCRELPHALPLAHCTLPPAREALRIPQGRLSPGSKMLH